MNNSAVNLRKGEKKRRCKVLFSYQPLNEDELSLEIDDIVDVLEEVEEGWWRGIRKGKTGVFPSNFVEELAAAEQPEIIALSPEKMNLNNEVKPKPVKGIGYGNIFQDGAVKLKSTAPVATVAPTTIVLEPKEDKSARKSPIPPSVVVGSEAPELPPKKVREHARVLYSYEAQNDDELSLKEGDVINVLSKDIEDKGWWKGELNGFVGVFPDNFVDLIPATEEIRPKKPERADKEQSFIKSVKSNTDGKSQVDGNSSAKESLDASKAKTSSLSRGITSRGSSSEVSKKAIDEKVEKFDKMAAAAPPLPSKKPVLPPPLKKIVTPSSNYRNSNFGPSLGSVVPPSPTLSNSSPATTTIITSNSKTVPEPEVGKQKTIQDSNSNEVDLDLETSSEKLVHLTANRAKNPNRRPPSHVFLKGDNDKPNGEVKNGKKNVAKTNNLDSNKLLSSVSQNLKESIPEADERNIRSESLRTTKELEINHSKSVVDNMKWPSPIHSPVKTKTVTAGGDNINKVEKKSLVPKSEHIASLPTADTSLSDASIKLNSSVKDKSVPSSEYLALKQEVADLALQFEMFKNLTNRHISELSTEVKVEKEKRLILQAEMDTLKIQLQRK